MCVFFSGKPSSNTDAFYLSNLAISLALFRARVVLSSVPPYSYTLQQHHIFSNTTKFPLQPLEYGWESTQRYIRYLLVFSISIDKGIKSLQHIRAAFFGLANSLSSLLPIYVEIEKWNDAVENRDINRPTNGKLIIIIYQYRARDFSSSPSCCEVWAVAKNMRNNTSCKACGESCLHHRS